MTHRVLIFLAVLSLQVVPTWGASMPRGSFLTQPAHSAWQLATQVRKNPLVADRYERHYGVSALQFAQYAQSQLGIRPLARGGRYRVFFIRKDGSIDSGMRRLRKGTPVFVHLRTGEPVLLAECGNPMNTSLPGYSRSDGQSSLPPKPRVSEVTPVQGETEVVALPPPVASLPPDLLELSEMVQVVDVPLWEAPFSLVTPDMPLLRTGGFAHAAPVSLSPLFMVGASGLLWLGAGAGGRGGTTPPVVPEPASLTFWAIAGGAAASAKWLRARRANIRRRRQARNR